MKKLLGAVVAMAVLSGADSAYALPPDFWQRLIEPPLEHCEPVPMPLHVGDTMPGLPGPAAGVPRPAIAHHHPDRESLLQRLIALTESQKAAIARLVEDDRQQNEPLQAKEAQLHRCLAGLERADSLDSQAVRALAGEMTGVAGQLLVARVSLQHRLRATLTPEQRLLLDRWEDGRNFQREPGRPGVGPL